MHAIVYVSVNVIAYLDQNTEFRSAISLVYRTDIATALVVYSHAPVETHLQGHAT